LCCNLIASLAWVMLYIAGCHWRYVIISSSAEWKKYRV
jgi:hypothetical protein